MGNHRSWRIFTNQTVESRICPSHLTSCMQNSLPQLSLRPYTLHRELIEIQSDHRDVKCSHYFQDGTSVNVCSGDFGGPVTIQDADQRTTQIGVSSFINPLGCTRGFPGGFTRVSVYLEWIGANSDVVIRDGF